MMDCRSRWPAEAQAARDVASAARRCLVGAHEPAVAGMEEAAAVSAEEEQEEERGKEAGSGEEEGDVE